MKVGEAQRGREREKDTKAGIMQREEKERKRLDTIKAKKLKKKSANW